MTPSPRPVQVSPRESAGITPVWAMTFLLIHVPLGLALRPDGLHGLAYPVVSTTHAVLVSAIGIAWAIAGHEDRVAIWGGYAAASDVLWRMTRASVPWEFAKYLLVLVFVLAILRSGRLRGSILPFIYMGLLIPSSLLVVWSLGLRGAFDGLSFNLSGPLALTAAVWFFSRMTLTAGAYAALLVAMIGPTVCVGLVALSRMLRADPLTITRASNVATSGGYGPNQVSSLLGFGAMLSLLLFLTARKAWWPRAIFFGLAVGFACQSALTFSRGGLYAAAGAVAVAVPFLLQDGGARRRVFFGGAIALAVTMFLVVPGLEAFTEGALGARFSDMGTTGRDRIALADLAVWQENPIFGVGPGRGPAGRLGVLMEMLASHTEWSRLLAEHGVFGLGAALCLIALAWRAAGRGRRGLERALAVAFIVWAFLFMFHAGMRLATPAFAIGLAQCRIRPASGRLSEDPT